MLCGIKMGLRLILSLLGLFSFCRLQMLKAENLKHPRQYYIKTVSKSNFRDKSELIQLILSSNSELFIYYE